MAARFFLGDGCKLRSQRGEKYSADTWRHAFTERSELYIELRECLAVPVRNRGQGHTQVLLLSFFFFHPRQTFSMFVCLFFSPGTIKTSEKGID